MCRLVIIAENWIWGSFMCYFLPMLHSFPIHASMLTFLMIAVDRYRLIVHPMKPRVRLIIFLPSANKVAGKQCFQSCVSVSLSVHRGSPTQTLSMVLWTSLYRTAPLLRHRALALPHTVQASLHRHWLLVTDRHKQAVHILLESFLVIFKFYNCKIKTC